MPRQSLGSIVGADAYGDSVDATLEAGESTGGRIAGSTGSSTTGRADLPLPAGSPDQRYDTGADGYSAWAFTRVFPNWRFSPDQDSESDSVGNAAPASAASGSLAHCRDLPLSLPASIHSSQIPRRQIRSRGKAIRAVSLLARRQCDRDRE
ncbi:MAG: hypothetical protein K1X78_25180 [Verrucomicrobiaceae bacterium]|nr:hypothetical protein [Verrucomicrobiaceae bacterium]